MLKDALGGYRGTVGELDRIIAEEPCNAMAWFDRANARSAAGDHCMAIADYDRALLLGIRFRERIATLGNRGLSKLAIGDYAGAADDFTELIEKRPQNGRLLATAYRKRAEAREKLGDEPGAAADRLSAGRIGSCNATNKTRER